VKLIRKRLTYANVMSSIAVFLILGGATAFAAKKVGSSEIMGNSITTGKLKKEAVTSAKLKKASVDASKLADGAVTSSKLADGAVTTSKIVNDAVTGDKVNESTLGIVPNAAKLGGQSPSAYQGRVQWAIVNANGTEILKQSGGISLTGHITGTYGIRFPTSTVNAAIQVTPAISGFAGSESGTTDAKAGPCPVSPDCGGVGGTTTNDAVVILFKAGTIANQGFFVSLTP
jgi:hypothetical protein